MTLIVERPSQADDIQSALDYGERVVIDGHPVLDGIVLRDDADIVIRRGGSLTLDAGHMHTPPGVRVHRVSLSGGGWLYGGIDLTDITHFNGADVMIDVTGDPAFDDLAPVVCGNGAGQYYNRFYGLHISAKRLGIALSGGANGFEVRGGDLRMFEADAEAIVCDATAANLNRVLLECSVEGVSGTALRVKGGATTQAHVREAVSCEWASGPSYRVHADGKHYVESMGVFGNAPDVIADSGWTRRGTNYGAGLGPTYDLHVWSKLT